MFSIPRVLPRRLLAAALVLGASGAALAFVCSSGTAFGRWRLPIGTQTGRAVGLLIGPSSTQPRYHFSAVLTATPSPCLTCIQGTIVGTLDDGIGTGPDYFVRGEYSGTFFNGSGTFDCRIIAPSAAAPAGRLHGRFTDSPADATDGTFQGDWIICP